MSNVLVLFLPGADALPRWLRIGDGTILARGEGFPAPTDGETQLLAVAPAAAVTLHWADLPDRSPAQTLAAARLLAADVSASPISELHVAVGREGGSEERPISVVAASQMTAWLATLAEHGLASASITPAPLLLPRPQEGFISADLGGETVVRGSASGFADEPGLTSLVTGGAAPAMLSREEMESAIIGAAVAPALDLRQGAFAQRRRFAIDWGLIRRAGWLALAVLIVSLAIGLVQSAKYALGAESLEAQADQLARKALPRGETVNDADRQLDARLAGLRGGGLGFSRTAAIVFSVVRSVPGVELTGLAFDTTGALRITVAAQNEGQATDLKTRIEAQGLKVRAGVFQAGGGRISGEMTVTQR